jgi:type I restriction enzyme S subunit
LPDPVGRTTLIPDVGQKMITAVDCTIMRFKKDILPQWFIYYSLSPEYQDEINKAVTGATRQRISRSNLGSVKIPVPSISDQKRLISIFDGVSEKTIKAKESAEKNLQNARELFEAYLQNIFFNPGDGWEEKRLGDAYDVRDGTHDSPKYQKEGYPLVTSKNLKDDKLTLEDIQFISEKDYQKINERSKVDQGDILFAMIGTIGNPVVIETEPNFAIKNVALFKVPKNQNSYFLKYFLDSKMVIDKMIHDAKGTTQKFVGLGYLRDFKILLPSFTEQQKIVAKLNVMSGEVKKLVAIYQQKLADLEELKKSVLHKAFNGELVGACS